MDNNTPSAIKWVEGVFFVLGWIVMEEDGPRRPRLEQQRICGADFAVLQAAPPRGWRQKRRWGRALEAMAAAGVRCTAVQGPAEPWLRRYGLHRAQEFSLRRALLPQLLDRAEADWGLDLRNGTVLLSAPSADRETRELLLQLGRRVRYVAVSAGSGQGELETLLLQRLGLGQGRPDRAILELCLGEERQGQMPALHLGWDCARRQRLSAAVDGEEWPETVLAALFQAGKVEKGAICLKSVEFRP